MPSIALVMIARDEARCIERCLRSAAAHVDEICVLDTGSVDDTAALARLCGARVVPWSWCGDFAAARNAALDQTGCDWRLILDADEWIQGGAVSLHGYSQSSVPHIGLVRVDSLIESAQGTTQSAPSWLPRLLPRGVGYEGRVHEQPLSALPRQRLALQVAHDGYLPAQMALKRGRNRELLLLALRADPQDAYLQYQLGKDFEVHGDYAAAEPWYARAMSAAGPAAGWCHDLVLRRLFTLKKLAQFETAMAIAEAEMPRWGESPDFYFTLGDLLLDWAAAQPQHAPMLLPMIESSWLRALDIGENPALQDTVQGRGSFLAAHNLAVMFGALGDELKARHWREQAAWLRSQATPACAAALPDPA
ncbi:MAG TPA: glycosyltransferase family 2 protein [Rubrivivax sp.]|nr:glycosyltransferase family 2 protein [Rubrivivax sp.]